MSFNNNNNNKKNHSDNGKGSERRKSNFDWKKRGEIEKSFLELLRESFRRLERIEEEEKL